MDIIKENRVKEMEKTAHIRTPEALQYAEKTMTARMGIYKRGKLLCLVSIPENYTITTQKTPDILGHHPSIPTYI